MRSDTIPLTDLAVAYLGQLFFKWSHLLITDSFQVDRSHACQHERGIELCW